MFDNIPNRTQQPLNSGNLLNMTMRVSQPLTNGTLTNYNTQQVMNTNNTVVQPQQSTSGVSMNTTSRQTSIRSHSFGNGQVLQRGQKTDIQGVDLKVCMGWIAKNPNCELDVSAFMLDQTNKVIGEDWFVFYGQRISPDRSMQHLDPDNNDDGIVSLNLGLVDNRVKKIVFVVTINEALQNGQTCR